MDFTVHIYRKLLDQILKTGYVFQTFTEFIENREEKVILLRHDVDAKKLNSLHFAEIQHRLGIKGAYYFRMVPQSFDEEVIKKIADLGHEIGYHYEDMDFAFQRTKNQEPGIKIKDIKEEDLYDVAIEIFQENLEKLRKLYPVKTICMHGSPLSKFDNKALWKKYKYKDYGIIGEPYFDIDFNDVFYLTDTGRRWDGDKVSIRDKVVGNHSNRFMKLRFHSTQEIINAANAGRLPDRMMMTFHPQRWNDNFIPWFKELMFQNIKNQIKRIYIRKN